MSILVSGNTAEMNWLYDCKQCVIVYTDNFLYTNCECWIQSIAVYCSALKSVFLPYWKHPRPQDRNQEDAQFLF